VHDLTDTGVTGYRAADVGEALQEIDVVENGVAEAFSGRGEVGPGILEDRLEVG
jgi:hypothetical protein